MKKKTTSKLYFLSGILFAITSIIHFSSTETYLGITYICLAITFTSLGFSYKKKEDD
jgi:hypothetical protein